jgi:hypothetical protein
MTARQRTRIVTGLWMCTAPVEVGRKETKGIEMYQKDAVIVGYAETKIVDKSDRDIWELSAEILEKVIVQTGIEKDEIDGLVLSSSMTAAGSVFWSQTNADMLGLDLKFTRPSTSVDARRWVLSREP